MPNNWLDEAPDIGEAAITEENAKKLYKDMARAAGWPARQISLPERYDPTTKKLIVEWDKVEGYPPGFIDQPGMLQFLASMDAIGKSKETTPIPTRDLEVSFRGWVRRTGQGREPGLDLMTGEWDWRRADVPEEWIATLPRIAQVQIRNAIRYGEPTVGPPPDVVAKEVATSKELHAAGRKPVAEVSPTGEPEIPDPAAVLPPVTPTAPEGLSDELRGNFMQTLATIGLPTEAIASIIPTVDAYIRDGNDPAQAFDFAIAQYRNLNSIIMAAEEIGISRESLISGIDLDNRKLAQAIREFEASENYRALTTRLEMAGLDISRAQQKLAEQRFELDKTAQGQAVLNSNRDYALRVDEFNFTRDMAQKQFGSLSEFQQEQVKQWAGQLGWDKEKFQLDADLAKELVSIQHQNALAIIEKEAQLTADAVAKGQEFDFEKIRLQARLAGEESEKGRALTREQIAIQRQQAERSDWLRQAEMSEEGARWGAQLLSERQAQREATEARRLEALAKLGPADWLAEYHMRGGVGLPAPGSMDWMKYLDVDMASLEETYAKNAQWRADEMARIEQNNAAQEAYAKALGDYAKYQKSLQAYQIKQANLPFMDRSQWEENINPAAQENAEWARQMRASAGPMPPSVPVPMPPSDIMPTQRPVSNWLGSGAAMSAPMPNLRGWLGAGPSGRAAIGGFFEQTRGTKPEQLEAMMQRGLTAARKGPVTDPTRMWLQRG